jgi:hypothetical protein
MSRGVELYDGAAKHLLNDAELIISDHFLNKLLCTQLPMIGPIMELWARPRSCGGKAIGMRVFGQVTLMVPMGPQLQNHISFRVGIIERDVMCGQLCYQLILCEP